MKNTQKAIGGKARWKGKTKKQKADHARAMVLAREMKRKAEREELEAFRRTASGWIDTDPANLLTSGAA